MRHHPAGSRARPWSARCSPLSPAPTESTDAWLFERAGPTLRRLTPQQRRVVEALVDAQSFDPLADDEWVVATVARAIGVEPQTVRYHRDEARRRLDRAAFADHLFDGDLEATVAGTRRSRDLFAIASAFGRFDYDVPGTSPNPADKKQAGRPYQVVAGSRSVGKGARKAGRLVREASEERVPVDQLAEFVTQRGGDPVAAARYLRTYPHKVAYHVDDSGVQRFGVGPVKVKRVDPAPAVT